MATLSPPYFFDEFLLPAGRKQPSLQGMLDSLLGHAGDFFSRDSQQKRPSLAGLTTVARGAAAVVCQTSPAPGANPYRSSISATKAAP
ncbi:hypothetical protein ACVWXD_002412 [Pseudomonas sp. TE3911]